MENINSNEQSAQWQKNFIQQTLPNSTAVLVLGIISIALSWCYAIAIVGLAAGIIALALATKPLRLYKENLNLYTVGAYKKIKAGQTCAIVGIIVSALSIFLIIYFFIIYFGIQKNF